MREKFKRAAVQRLGCTSANVDQRGNLVDPLQMAPWGILWHFCLFFNLSSWDGL